MGLQMQVFTASVQVLCSGAKQTAQEVQNYLSSYLQQGGRFSVNNAWYKCTHAHSAEEVQNVAPPVPAPSAQQYVFNVYYGAHGSQGCLLGAGSTLHGAKVAALRAYNDEQCATNCTWEQMLTQLANSAWYVQIVRTVL